MAGETPREPQLGIEWLSMSVASVLYTEQDPEITLTVALTLRELNTLVLALYFPGRLFPELSDDVAGLIRKLQELGAAQEFFNH